METITAMITAEISNGLSALLGITGALIGLSAGIYGYVKLERYIRKIMSLPGAF